MQTIPLSNSCNHHTQSGAFTSVSKMLTPCRFLIDFINIVNYSLRKETGHLASEVK